MSQVYDNCRFQPSHYLPACAGMTMEVLYVQRHYSGSGRDTSKHHFRTASSFCPACWIPVCAGMTSGSLPTPSFPRIRESMPVSEKPRPYRTVDTVVSDLYNT